MTRWIRTALAIVLVAGSTRSARAQAFGQYGSARTLPVNAHAFGVQLEFGPSLVGLLGDIRMSFYPDVDFGFQGGVNRYQTDLDVSTARLGADFRYQATHTKAGAPVDLALGAFIGLEAGDGLSQLSLGPSAAVSRPVMVNGAERITPYLSWQIRYAEFQVQGDSKHDVSFPLRVGSEFAIVTGMRAVGEVQFRIGDDFLDDVSYGIGVNFDL